MSLSSSVFNFDANIWIQIYAIWLAKQTMTNKILRQRNISLHYYSIGTEIISNINYLLYSHTLEHVDINGCDNFTEIYSYTIVQN